MILCGHKIERGEKKHIKIPVNEEDTLDAVLYCGDFPGKTLVVAAGVHGCEYVGIEALKRLIEELNPEKLSGNVIVLPLVNAQGFLSGTKQVVPEDNVNLNLAFPGRQDGTLSEQIAYTIENEIYPYADFLIDLHSGDINESLFPLVFIPSVGSDEVNRLALEGAKMLSVPYRVRSTAKNGLYSWAVQKGIPSLLIERGEGGRWSELEVTECMEDVYRIMAYLSISEQKFTLVQQQEIAKAKYEESKIYGYWYPEITAGSFVSEGDILGILQPYPKEEPVEIKAEFDGIILYYTTALGVQPGDAIVAYGRA